MGKHMQGPWSFSDPVNVNHHDMVTIFFTDKTRGQFVLDNDKNPVLTPAKSGIFRLFFPVNTGADEMKEVANLVSSAPDLLAALELAHEALLHANRNGWTIKNDVFGPINASIRKARGQ